VLRPEEAIARAGEYAPADWEERVAKMRVATSQNVGATLEPRRLVVGVAINNAAKAYPLDALLKQSPLIDDVGGTPIFIVVGDDRKSVRAFERTVDGRKLEFFAKHDVSSLRLIDAETGSEWDFTGRAISGSLAGKQLQKVPVLDDYWFDWKTYHPDTMIYQLGDR